MARTTKFFFVIVIVALNGCAKASDKFTNSDANIIGDLTEHFHTKWVLFIEDEEDVGLIKNIKTMSERFLFHAVLNKTFLKRILANHTKQLNFFQRTTAITMKEKLHLNLLLEKVASPYLLTWIMFGNYALIPDLYIPVSNTVIFVNSTPGEVFPKRVYHLKPKMNATVRPVKLKQPPVKLPPGKKIRGEKMNFQNISMNMLVLREGEECMKMNGTVSKVECVHQEILQLIGKRLNFSINVVECVEKEFPYVYPNGSDSELFLRLKHREVEFSAVGHILWTRARRPYMELVWPTFVLKSRMYLRQGILTGQWLTYLRPLESSVWWGILIWILLTGILIQIFEALLFNQLKFNLSFFLGFITSTLKALQVCCNQALSDIPSSYSIRIIYFLKFFGVLIFFQAYCGSLVSSLTVVISHFPFKDLRGFFENKQYQIMTLQKGFHSFYFRKVIGEGRKGDFMLPQTELPETIQQAVDKLCRDKYLAFTEFREDFLNFGTLNCKISELPTPSALLFLGIAIPKNGMMKEFLRRELIHLKLTGLVKRLGLHLSTRADFRQTRNEFTTVSMTQIFSIFILLGLGIILSVVILIVELTLDKRRSSTDLESSLRKFRRKPRNSLNVSAATSGELYLKTIGGHSTGGSRTGAHGTPIRRKNAAKKS